jgi:hypothetical protein
MRITWAVAGLLLLFALSTKDALSQDSAAAASPELIGELTKTLSVTPAQANGGAGALFGLAKSRLSPADFSKVASCVPGMDSLLKSAPATSGGAGIPGLSGIVQAKGGSNIASLLSGALKLK